MGLGKTEWEDILIEKGIMAAPKESTVEHHPDIIYDIENRERDEIDDLFSDEENDEFIQQYKANKFLKLQQETNFGSITEISRSDFLADVTEASKKHPVILYLYQSAIINCQILGKWLTEVAAPGNPKIKFVQMQSTRCIQNYPDSNLPTILLYRLGGVQKQLLHADIPQTQQLIQQIHEAEAEKMNEIEE